MQILCEVSLSVYLAADNPFDVVRQPDVCGRCKTQDCFHRHGVYCRYVQDVRRKVARYLCKACRMTVSVLPAFVLPYRCRLLEDVDRYFDATDAERREQSGADTLRHYWRQWCAHMPTVQRTGWPVTKFLVREPRAYWRELRRAAEGMARAQVRLLSRFRLALLRRYACHRVPRCRAIAEVAGSGRRGRRPTHPLG